MNALANVSKSLKEALEKNGAVKKLLTLDVAILFGGLGLQFFFWLINLWTPWIILSNFLSLFRTVLYYIMIAGMVLTFANAKWQLPAAGAMLGSSSLPSCASCCIATTTTLTCPPSL